MYKIQKAEKLNENIYLMDRRSSSCGKTLRAWTVRYCKNR